MSWHLLCFLTLSHLQHTAVRDGYNLKNAFSHAFDHHLSYDRKPLIAVKTAGTNLLTKGRDAWLECNITDLSMSKISGYNTTPNLLLLLETHIKE